MCEVRESKDPVIDSKGRKLLSLMDEVGGNILNGRMPDDKHGEMTFCGAAGSSVIDYAISSFDFISWVNSFYISLKEFSDHTPLTIILSVPKKVVNATLSICPEKLLWKPKRVFKYVDMITEMPSIDFIQKWDSIDDLVSTCTDKIKAASISNCGKCHFVTEKAWFDSECFNARTKMLQFMKDCNQFSTARTRVKYVAQRSYYMKSCAKKKFF